MHLEEHHSVVDLEKQPIVFDYSQTNHTDEFDWVLTKRFYLMLMFVNLILVDQVKVLMSMEKMNFN